MQCLNKVPEKKCEKKEEVKKEVKKEIKKAKIDFRKKKENTICSLFEIEHFLCNFKSVYKGVKLFKILKW